MYLLFSWYKIMEVFVIANKGKDLLVNDQIKVNEVLVIGPNGEQMGIKQINDALTLASYAGFDLVLINPNGKPPVCKIMDYNKFKYQNNHFRGLSPVEQSQLSKRILCRIRK